MKIKTARIFHQKMEVYTIFSMILYLMGIPSKRRMGFWWLALETANYKHILFTQSPHIRENRIRGCHFSYYDGIFHFFLICIDIVNMFAVKNGLRFCFEEEYTFL